MEFKESKAFPLNFSALCNEESFFSSYIYNIYRHWQTIYSVVWEKLEHITDVCEGKGKLLYDLP